VAVPRLVKKRDVSLNAVHVLVARRLAARFCCVDLCGCLLLRACVCVCLAGLRPRDWLVLGSVHTVLAHAFLARLPAGVQVGVGLVLLGGEFGVVGLRPVCCVVCVRRLFATTALRAALSCWRMVVSRAVSACCAHSAILNR
jgi:hypothetical protein